MGFTERYKVFGFECCGECSTTKILRHLSGDFLFCGGRGTGREQGARAIVYNSKRQDTTIMVIPCLCCCMTVRTCTGGGRYSGGRAFESCTVHGSRTFKSFAAQRYRVPALSAKNPFPNLSHHAHKYSQESRQCRESARKKHHVSGHR